MTPLQLTPTDELIAELESRFEFFVAAWREPSGKYNRHLFGANDCNGFAALGCIDWLRIGVAEQMGIAGGAPDGT